MKNYYQYQQKIMEKMVFDCRVKNLVSCYNGIVTNVSAMSSGGWNLLCEQPPLENEYIELMFDNGLTTKRHWWLSIFDETTMIKPVYWRACR